jgi:hypothetical protein
MSILICKQGMRGEGHTGPGFAGGLMGWSEKIIFNTDEIYLES